MRYKIYKLIGYNNNNVIYVGITKRLLEKRLSGHQYKDITSKIELIEETDDKSREKYWIKRLIKEGNNLLNITFTFDYSDWLVENKEYDKNYYKELMSLITKK